MEFKQSTVYHISQPQDDYKFPAAVNAVKIGRGKFGYSLLKIFSGFDIETTNIETPEGKHLAFAYHMQFSVANEKQLNVYLFREWPVLLHFIDSLVAFYGLGSDKHIVTFVANLSFEFQFIRKRLEWDQDEFAFFAKDRYQPLKATYHGLEFRECLSLTGGNLAQLAKDYCTTQKLITEDENGVKHSDLDYKKERSFLTPMTETEIQYCINDVVIISEYSYWLFDNYIARNRKIPMTFTGVLHQEFKDELKRLCFQRDDKFGLEHGNSYYQWMYYMNRLQPTKDFYELIFKWLFRGGYVHGNCLYTSLDGLKAHMRDVTSSYPTEMNLSYFPGTVFKRCSFQREKLNTKCLIIHVGFDFIRSKTTHTIESKNKIPVCYNGKFDNGRLICADHAEFYFTEMDFQIFELFYSYEGEPQILECWEAERKPLPKYLLNVLNRHYATKEKLKREGLNDTQEYTISKQRVNTCYGDTVKRMRLTKVLYDNMCGWTEDVNGQDYDKEAAKNILSPYFGIWVTSSARFHILKMLFRLHKAGVKVFYIDTDSLKYEPCHKAEKIFKRYNNWIRKRRKQRGLRAEYFNGLGEYDKECVDKKTGEWHIVLFKMQGSKRYLYSYGGKIYATIAGMPKASINQLGKTAEEILHNFDKMGFHLTPEESGKLTAAYTDEEYSYPIDGVTMTELSGVALYEIPFTMTVKEDYRNHIREIQEIMHKEDTSL